MIEAIHERGVKQRRVICLASWVSALLDAGDRSVLDVGSGDGQLAAAVQARRAGVQIRGIDLLVRPGTAIPVEPYDGTHFPLPDKSVDVALFVDVLHHTPDPLLLLREAVRVARRAVIIKDHRVSGLLARPTLRFMDGVGNARFGVALPYNYWTPDQWSAAFSSLHLTPNPLIRTLRLYPAWANWLFGRDLHFITRLTCPQP